MICVVIVCIYISRSNSTVTVCTRPAPCHIATPTFTAAGPAALFIPKVARLSMKTSSSSSLSFLDGVLRGDQADGTVRPSSFVDQVDNVSNVSVLCLSGRLGGVTHW